MTVLKMMNCLIATLSSNIHVYHKDTYTLKSKHTVKFLKKNSKYWLNIEIVHTDLETVQT